MFWVEMKTGLNENSKYKNVSNVVLCNNVWLHLELKHVTGPTNEIIKISYDKSAPSFVLQLRRIIQ